MSSDLNMVQIIGRLGQDPEIRHTQAGDPIANLSVATSEKWRDRHSGERREKTEWHRVVIFGKLAEIAEQYLEKGSQVYLQGKLQTRKWQDRDGNDRYSTEIVLQGFDGRMSMLGGGSGNGGGARRREDEDDYRGNSRAKPHEGAHGGGGAHDDLDDEVPF